MAWQLYWEQIAPNLNKGFLLNDCACEIHSRVACIPIILH